MPICCGVGGLERKHILLLGLEDSGKTYLLYKLKIRHVDPNKLRRTLRDMKKTKDEHGRPQDPGYHHEEFARPYPYAIWECPGSVGMRHFWPVIYRSVDVNSVVFMVDCNETPERFAQARKELQRLIHADELRSTAIAVLINLRRTKNSDVKTFDSDNPYKFLLGLDDLLPTSASRVRMFAMDVSLVVNENNKIWLDILEFFRRVTSTRKLN